MTGPSRDEMMELVALYALGVLSRDEAAAAAAFIASDAQARREYDDLRAAADMVAHSADEPVDSARSARMKDRLMAHVRADAAPARSPVRAVIRPAYPAWLWGTGLAAAAAVVFSVVTVVQDVNLRGNLAVLERRIDTLTAQNRQGERLAAQDHRMMTDLLAPDAKRYAVAAGTVIVRRDHIYFAFSQLPAPPKGHVYQAWTAAKGSTGMVPSVTFAPNPDGVAVVALPVDATRVGTVAVSVEPDGGSKAPTTTPTFVKPLT